MGLKNYARVDFVCLYEDRIVCIEVDEGQHAHYGVACDIARMMDIVAQQSMHSLLPIHFIRFNPDAWQVDGKTQKGNLLHERHRRLLGGILWHNTDFAITYLFYDMLGGRPAVLEDCDFPAELKGCCRWGL